MLIATILLCVLALGCVQTVTEERPLYIVTLPPSTMLDQLKSGDIDGFIAWEPFNAEAVVSGYGRYLIQSGEVWPNHPCCVLAVSDSYKDDKIIEALVWAHIKATQMIQQIMIRLLTMLWNSQGKIRT